MRDIPDPGEVRFARRGSSIQLVLAGGAAVAFLAASLFCLWLIVSAGRRPAFDVGGLLLMAAVFGFFGLLIASGVLTMLRGGLARTAIAVGPRGLWLPGIGRLSWGDISEVRLESFAGPAGGEGSALTTNYRRVGIAPRDPTLAARRPALERVGWGISRAYYRFASPLIGRRAIDFAPFGVTDFEVAAPIEAVVESIRTYHPVVDVSDAAAALTAAPPASSSGPGSPFAAAAPTRVHIGGQDIEIGRAPASAWPEQGGMTAPAPMHSPPAAEASDPAAEARRRRYLAAQAAPRGPSTAPPVMPLWVSLIFLAFGVMPIVIALSGAMDGSGGAIAFLLFGLLFGGIGVYFVWRYLRSAWLRRRLSQIGTTTKAEVIGVVNTHVQVNEVEMWVVHYGYQAPGGPRVGESPSMPYAAASAWSPGDTVRIAYDPNDPGMSVWLEPRRS